MDPLAPFDPALIDRVAGEYGFDSAQLANLLEAHHDHAATVPGVDELVMEWRRFLPYDPLIVRTDDAYHLAVKPEIWAEFAEQVGFTAAELAAVRTVHKEQVHTAAQARGDELSDEMREPMILAR